MSEMAKCWCGNSEFTPFSPAYGTCGECGTLVSLEGMSPEQLLVHDDDSDFYGKQYWLDHQHSDLGFPDIHTRARADLTERNLHWLSALLKYKQPPASVLEIGCSHGSFVGLMQLAGYQAQGVEMSPWVVDFGKRTFGVPISVGPVENLDIPKGSLDAIALMDVLEHLPDPVATMAHCLELLKPNGILLIQTPQFREEMRFADLQETKGPFLEQLKADEHLFLLSERAVRRLFDQLGAPHLRFEPAIFSQYDMFLTVSREPLHVLERDEAERTLLSSPGGRMSLALLDMWKREGVLASTIAELTQYKVSADAQVQTLTTWLRESRSENEALTIRGSDLEAQINTLTGLIHKARSENESLSIRGSDLDAQVRTLTRMIHEFQAANAEPAAGKEDAEFRIQVLTSQIGELEREIVALGEARSLASSRVEHLTADLAGATQLLSAKERLLNKPTVRACLAISRVIHRLVGRATPGDQK